MNDHQTTEEEEQTESEKSAQRIITDAFSVTQSCLGPISWCS